MVIRYHLVGYLTFIGLWFVRFPVGLWGFDYGLAYENNKNLKAISKYSLVIHIENH